MLTKTGASSNWCCQELAAGLLVCRLTPKMLRDSISAQSQVACALVRSSKGMATTSLAMHSVSTACCNVPACSMKSSARDPQLHHGLSPLGYSLIDCSVPVL